MKEDLIVKLIEMLVQGSNAPTKVSRNRAVVAFANNCIIFGYTDAEELGQITIQKARYCYYYAKPVNQNEKGFMALAKYGPADGSKISSPVDNVTVDAICIIDAEQDAINTWENSKWES